ncbi:MAG: serine/threonine protein kinase [Pirellulaceae bacterium]|nr:MAG: serine/threonine protein kinase [Pirellulaceae bacterium]
MNQPPVDSDDCVLPPGTTIGPYQIERLIGRGGMADVYFAIHRELLRPAALKVLRASLASDMQHLQRFQQEARAAASLVHPNIVQVYDVNLDGPYRYIAQEYIPGTNLRQYLSRPSDIDQATSTALPRDQADAAATTASSCDGTSASPDRPLPINECLSILLQILAALSRSHRAGIVHRDIKPENIMLTQEGEVKVADFGLARVLLGDDPQLTQAGTTMGTPLYMSPEQIQDGKVDIRSDLYSLGVTLFHMLAGQPPFSGDTPLALAMKHVHNTPPDIRQLRPDVPASLAQLVARLLAKNPAERFDTPMQVIDYLRENRDRDLAAFWPEQVVPLPGVAPSDASRATIELQSKLALRRQHRRSRLLRTAVVAIAVAMAFTAGFAVTYDRTELPSSDIAVFRDIPRQETPRQQYLLALLSKDLHALDKWEAVGVYFPAEENDTNRLYVAQASLQLARALQDRREYTGAMEILDRLTNDGRLPVLYRALAQVQKAALYEELEEDDQFQRAFEQARRMVSQPDFPTGDRQKINDVVRRLGGRLARLWIGN